MISSIVSRLVILVFGTLYPAYASYKAVRTKNVKEYVKWMMYWIVFALFTCAETFTDVFFSFWFPFYYEIKIILVLWLLSPATKGSSILYRRFVHPALIRREAEIDEALARATEQGYTAVLHLGTKGVNYATTVLMQTAIKNLSIICPSTTSSLPDRQSDLAISSLANPSSATRLENNQTDSPDGSENCTPCTKCNVLIDNSDKNNHWLYCDQSTTDDSDNETDMAEAPCAEESDEDKSDEENPVFKMPENNPPKKTRKPRKERVTAPTRQQKTRACRQQSTAKQVYDDDFSDADLNFAN